MQLVLPPRILYPSQTKMTSSDILPSGRQKIHHFKRRRSATSVHGFVLAVFRARAQSDRTVLVLVIV